jgi:hypothetical protein
MRISKSGSGTWQRDVGERWCGRMHAPARSPVVVASQWTSGQGTGSEDVWSPACGMQPGKKQAAVKARAGRDPGKHEPRVG